MSFFNQVRYMMEETPQLNTSLFVPIIQEIHRMNDEIERVSTYVASMGTNIDTIIAHTVNVKNKISRLESTLMRMCERVDLVEQKNTILEDQNTVLECAVTNLQAEQGAMADKIEQIQAGEPCSRTCQCQRR
jgi:chromosome segregation ATPase